MGVWRPLGGRCGTLRAPRAFDDCRRARLQQAGVRVKVLDMPKIFTQIADDHDIITAYDLARSFKEVRRDHHDKCDPALLEYLDKGDRDTAQDYARTLDLADACRRAFLDVARDVDVLHPCDPGRGAGCQRYRQQHLHPHLDAAAQPSLTLPIAARGRATCRSACSWWGFRKRTRASVLGPLRREASWERGCTTSDRPVA